MHVAIDKYLLVDPKKFLDSYEMPSSLLEIEITPESAADTKLKCFVTVLQVPALKVFFGSFFVYNLKLVLGPEVHQIQEGDDNEPKLSYNQLIKLMMKQMFSEEQTLVRFTIDGSCNLLMHGRLDELSEILSYMILFWHQKRPSQEDSPYGTLVEYSPAFFSLYSRS